MRWTPCETVGKQEAEQIVWQEVAMDRQTKCWNAQKSRNFKVKLDSVGC